MPTSLELAQVTIPPHVEFHSLLPLIRGERDIQYDAIYGAYRDDQQRMVLQGDYKLIYYPQIDKTLLFDLRQDPLEMHDLAESPQLATRRQQLTGQLHRLQQQMEDPLP